MQDSTPSEKPVDDPPFKDRDTHIKLKLNQLIWELARPGVTLAEAEEAAVKAFKVIWPLCDRETKHL